MYLIDLQILSTLEQQSIKHFQDPILICVSIDLLQEDLPKLVHNNKFTVGNPELKSAEAWNYELNTSFFGNEIGLISFSVYYKEINYMYHMLNNFNTAAERDANGILQDSIMMYFGIDWKSQMGTSAYNLTLPYNSPEPTKVWGFEFEQQINFHFLPGLLKNIVLSYNFSLINSETTIYLSKIITSVDSSGPIPVLR